MDIINDIITLAAGYKVIKAAINLALCIIGISAIFSVTSNLKQIAANITRIREIEETKIYKKAAEEQFTSPFEE